MSNENRKGPEKPEDQSPSKKLVACEEALTRLMNENAAYRENQERLQILIRTRAPGADGLSHLEVVRHVLEARDKAEDVLVAHRDVMKKAKAAIATGNAKEAYQILNLFLLTPLVIPK